jgi:tripeptidyl-peptidase II
VLLGTVTYSKGDERELGAGDRPGGYPLRWIPAIAAANASPSKSTDDDAADETFTDKPDRRRLAKLRRLDTDAARKQHLPRIVALVDRLLERIDLREFAAGYGTRVDPDDDEAVARRKRFDARRDLLVDLLYRKGRALGYMELPDVVARHPIADPATLDAAFEANFRELAKWVDTTDAKYVLLHVRHDRRKGRLAHALKELNEQIAESPPTFWYVKKRRDLYEELGWTHALEHERRRLAILFPKVREPL